MNRRIATALMRSIFGRDRVTQTVRPRPSSPESRRRTVGSSASNWRAAFETPVATWLAQPGKYPRSFLAFLADHHDRLAGQPRSPFLDIRMRPSRSARN